MCFVKDGLSVGVCLGEYCEVDSGDVCALWHGLRLADSSNSALELPLITLLPNMIVRGERERKRGGGGVFEKAEKGCC